MIENRDEEISTLTEQIAEYRTLETERDTTIRDQTEKLSDLERQSKSHISRLTEML